MAKYRGSTERLGSNKK